MPIDKKTQVFRASQFLNKLQEDNFYGEVTIKFEHGNIVHMRQIINMKIESIEEPSNEHNSRLAR